MLVITGHKTYVKRYRTSFTAQGVRYDLWSHLPVL